MKTGADTARPAGQAAPKLDLSGVMFANYQYQTNRGSSRGANKFDLERVYLTLKMPAGERASVRITTDVFQQQQSGNDSYYRGWTVRAKYAYLQYDYLKRGNVRAAARFGLVHNVFIEHDETYWPRWMSTVATDRHGYFSSADAGLASAITLPRELGEIYAAITNGPGYTSREVDRFKDYGARLTLTPFASRADGLLGSLALTAWSYQGSTGSRFAGGGAGQLGPVGSSLQRDRWGVFAAVKNPALTIAAQYAARADEGETGSNTVTEPRAIVDSTGHLVSAYAIVRPFASGAGAARSVSLVGRVDRVTTNRALGQRHTLVIGGVAIDLTKAASLSLDYQEQLPRDGGPAAPSKAVFLHLIGRF
ncbi:MAG: hypothetical protein NUW01_04625 [Gemmatimonadaceae bacterium]|nr:hypothetical protein [Gemmatimonadaceae bacterium]